MGCTSKYGCFYQQKYGRMVNEEFNFVKCTLMSFYKSEFYRRDFWVKLMFVRIAVENQSTEVSTASIEVFELPSVNKCASPHVTFKNNFQPCQTSPFPAFHFAFQSSEHKKMQKKIPLKIYVSRWVYDIFCDEEKKIILTYLLGGT